MIKFNLVIAVSWCVRPDLKMLKPKDEASKSCEHRHLDDLHSANSVTVFMNRSKTFSLMKQEEKGDVDVCRSCTLVLVCCLVLELCGKTVYCYCDRAHTII